MALGMGPRLAWRAFERDDDRENIDEEPCCPGGHAEPAARLGAVGQERHLRRAGIDGAPHIPNRECDIPLTAVTTLRGSPWNQQCAAC